MLLPLYFPQAEASADTNNGRKPSGPTASSSPSESEVREVRLWRSAFGGDAASAVKARDTAQRAECVKISFPELRALRQATEQAVLGSKEDVRDRLQRAPSLFLAEVALGLHLAALFVQSSPHVRRAPATPLSSASVANPVELFLEESLESQQNLLPLPWSPDFCGQLLEIEVPAPELERPFEDVKSELVERYVGLRGTVVRAAAIVPIVKELHFTCGGCGGEVVLPACEGRFQYPKICPGKCRFARFTVERDRCTAMDFQRIRLQEDSTNLTSSDGHTRRIPKTIDCDLKGRFVGCCAPGDAVTLYGILRCYPASGFIAETGEGRQAHSKAMYNMSLDVHAIENQGRGEANSRASEDFTPLHLDFIRDIYKESERLPLLVASFCQQICGQSLVKAALLLALLGGMPVRGSGPAQRLRRRGDIHVLLLGDPGLGKSELLRALAGLSHRGVYVSGKTSSTAGLTASVTRDPGGGYSLEGGALVLADNGLCCVDEFDKMGADQQSLLEAMEQQTVSITKANIVCNLPARTTVVAAANPKKGSWDMSLTLAQNLQGVMSEALLSRFDVVFLMRTEESGAVDREISAHVLERRLSGTSSNVSARADTFQDWANDAREESGSAGPSLLRRCQQVPGSSALPKELLQVYLRYARRYVHPSLGPSAKQKIKECWLRWRRAEQLCATQLPVTPRKIEALIRLSEARARAELRPHVLRSDVEDVLEILRNGEDFQEQLPDQPIRKGKTAANAIVDRIQQMLTRQAKMTNSKVCCTEASLRAMAGTGVSQGDFSKALARLNDDGTLLMQGSGGYLFTGKW